MAWRIIDQDLWHYRQLQYTSDGMTAHRPCKRCLQGNEQEGRIPPDDHLARTAWKDTATWGISCMAALRAETQCATAPIFDTRPLHQDDSPSINAWHLNWVTGLRLWCDLFSWCICTIRSWLAKPSPQPISSWMWISQHQYSVCQCFCVPPPHQIYECGRRRNCGCPPYATEEEDCTFTRGSGPFWHCAYKSRRFHD